MTLLEKFYDYTEKTGFSKSDIQEEKDSEYTMLSFFESGEAGKMYHIALVFYEDENAEIYIRQSMEENYDTLTVLTELNELNSIYCGVTFLVADHMVVVKSYCKANGDIEVLLQDLVQNMKLAQKEFVKFT